MALVMNRVSLTEICTFFFLGTVNQRGRDKKSAVVIMSRVINVTAQRKKNPENFFVYIF